MVDIKEALELRAQGKTYEEIGRVFGVSKQRIYKVIGKRRRGSSDIEKIRNEKLRVFFRGSTLSYSALCTQIGCGRDRASVAKLERFLKGSGEPRLTLSQWIKFCRITALTPAELMERN